MKKLDEIIDYAYQYSPYYIQRGDKGEYKDIGILESEAYDADKLLAVNRITKYMAGDLTRGFTSGSSGKCKEVLWDKNEYIASMSELWMLRKRYYNITPKDKLCYFYTIAMDEYLNENEEFIRENSIAFSKMNLTKDKMKDIYYRMLDYKPKWLLLQPSIALLLCDVKQEFNLPDIESIQYIEFTGEILNRSIKELTRATFNCSIANQYGASELNSIAYECPCGNMHIMESNVYVESVNSEKNTQMRELLITSLTNFTTPLIKYRIGDFGEVKDVKCPCGNKSKSITLMSGRCNDYVLCEDGSIVSAYVFVKAIDCVNNGMEGAIKQYYIEQIGINLFCVKLYVDDGHYSKDEIEDAFCEMIFEQRLENAMFIFEHQNDYMPMDSNGKYKCFRNKILELKYTDID